MFLPGVYARVQGFLPWMKKIIADGECSSSSSGTSATTTSSATTTAAPATTTGQDYGNYGAYNYDG